MPRFEVHIPAADQHGFNVTFRVESDNWMAALKTGMQKLGEQGSSVQNILVDIQDDDSVHVTDSISGRVFRIRELSDAESATAQLKRAPPVIAEEKTEPGLPKPVDAPVIAGAPPPPRTEAAPAQRTADTQPFDVEANPPPRPPEPAPPPRPRQEPKKKHKPSDPSSVVELEAPTRPVTGPIGRAAKKSRKEQIEDTLAEVFERVQEIYALPGEEAALYFLLDLALEKIPAESGTVFFANLGTGDLTFRAVRGPKAKELLDAHLVIPAGTGIGGFCATEGVTVAVSDVEKDPRYYSQVAEKVNYVTRSILCAPMMTHGRSFGCLQILNKNGSSTFDEVEIGLASYIAHQAALYLNAR